MKFLMRLVLRKQFSSSSGSLTAPSRVQDLMIEEGGFTKSPPAYSWGETAGLCPQLVVSWNMNVYLLHGKQSQNNYKVPQQKQ